MCLASDPFAVSSVIISLPPTFVNTFFDFFAFCPFFTKNAPLNSFGGAHFHFLFCDYLVFTIITLTEPPSDKERSE